jgi:intracellular multiplication protein IcmP
MKGGGGQNQEAGKDMLYVAAFIVIIVGGTWFLYHDAVVRFVFRVRSFELHAMLSLALFFKHYLHLPLDVSGMQEGIQFIDGTSVKLATFQNVVTASVLSGKAIRYLDLFFGVIFAVLLIFFHTGAMFKNSYTMQLLSEAGLVLWPHHNVVVHRQLVKTELDEGAFAMSLGPMAFAHKAGILDKIVKNHKPAVKLRKGAAHRVFAAQMGPIWQSLQVLPEYQKALFAIFSAKAMQDGKSADRLIEQISRSAGSGGKLNFNGYLPLLRKHVRSKVVGRACSPHGYVYTVLASMLEAARNDGVVATAQFLWLKPLNRQLWYMLNSVGRQTAFCEVAGPFAHWVVEKRLRRPLKVPQVETAVSALDAALEDIVYNPDDYS